MTSRADKAGNTNVAVAEAMQSLLRSTALLSTAQAIFAKAAAEQEKLER